MEDSWFAISQNPTRARTKAKGPLCSVNGANTRWTPIPKFHNKVLFSDEAHFHLNGHVNKKNCPISSDHNPRAIAKSTLLVIAECLVEIIGSNLRRMLLSHAY